MVLAACFQGTQDLNVVSHDGPVTEVNATDGDSLTGADGTSYRLVGINAPDHPECLAEEAAERLAALVAEPVTVGGETLDQFGRRLVNVYRPGGEPGWVNRALVREGLVIAVHSDDAPTAELFDAQELARAEGIGLWDPTECGDEPLGTVEIIDAEPNPPGPDEEVLDAEWVELANRGLEDVDLTGWVVRDESTQNRYSFPAGFALAPDEVVTVTAGDGAFGFGLGSPIWNNGGDTVLLIDDQGRIVDYLGVGG